MFTDTLCIWNVQLYLIPDLGNWNALQCIERQCIGISTGGDKRGAGWRCYKRQRGPSKTNRYSYDCSYDDDDDDDASVNSTATQILHIYRSQISFRPSVHSERLFSGADNISKNRSSLLTESANKLICLSTWMWAEPNKDNISSSLYVVRL